MTHYKITVIDSANVERFLFTEANSHMSALSLEYDKIQKMGGDTLDRVSVEYWDDAWIKCGPPQMPNFDAV